MNANYDICSGCGNRIYFYEKTGMNSSWHKRCSDSWEKGYHIAARHATQMAERFQLPTADEIYWATQITYNEIAYNKVMEKIRKAYNRFAKGTT